MTDTIEKFYELTEKDFTPETEQELRELIPSGSVGIAQINPSAGNIEYNSKKVAKYIRHAQNIGLDLIIFPEMVLTGFPLEDTTGRYPTLVEENVKWLNQIAKITTKTTALVGFIEPVKDKAGKYYSAVAVLSCGEIKKIIRKCVLPKNSEFNDFRYIEPFTDKNQNSFEINEKVYGIIVGLQIPDNIDEIMKENPDGLIICDANPFCLKTEIPKSELLQQIAQKCSKPLIYVNQVGATDSTTFAGASIVYNTGGNLFARAKSFEEQFMIVNFENCLGKVYPDLLPKQKEEFSLDYDDDMERTYKTIIQGIKDYFGKTGFKRAVLGLSGGLDSTVCAVLLADALGCENVFGISMPSKITTQTSKSDAEQLAANLGINFAVAPIKDMVETSANCFNQLFEKVESKWECRYKQSYTMDNIQARSRAMYLWGISNEFGSCLPIATSDKSEAYMGYATINGDMSGGFAPIANVTKTKLFALARWMNKNREDKNAIPESIIQKRPGAELAIDPNTGKPLCAEDALMPYEFMDEVIWRLENKKESYDDLLKAEFLYEKTHKITKEQKAQWLDKFYRRMAGALYKGSIMPPSVDVDSSLHHKQPITSSGINYKSISENEIAEILSVYFQ